MFFTTTSDMEHKELERELNDETSSYLRSKIAERIELRHTPKIRFVYDNSIAYGNNIEKIISEIHEKEQ